MWDKVPVRTPRPIQQQTATKFDDERHQHNINEFDAKLAGLTAEMTRIEEARREYINRHNLNDKPVKP